MINLNKEIGTLEKHKDICDVGDIAVCKRHQVGLITTVNADKTKYKGIHLSKEKFGKSWQSKSPEFVINFKDLQYEGINLSLFLNNL